MFGRFNFYAIVPILFVLTGRGLLHWRNGWRIFAIVITCLYGILGLLIFFLAAIDLVFAGRDIKTWYIASWEGGPGWAFLVGLTICGYFGWQLHLLFRSDIVWRFRNRELREVLISEQGPWNPLRWRFSLGSMFLSMVIAAFVLARMNSAGVWHDTRHLSQTMSTPIPGPNGSQLNRVVEYGVRTSRFGLGREELTYVVLASWELSGVKRVEMRRGSRSQGAWLRTLEGDPIDLPGKHQLYGFVDGKLRTRDERVTLAELQDFVETGPNDDWTIDALVRHAQEMREQPKDVVSR